MFFATFFILFVSQIFVFYNPKKIQDNIKEIVIIAPKEYRDDYVAGIQMAIDEVNASGGVLGKSIRASYLDDKYSKEELQSDAILPEMLIEANIIGQNDDIIGVVGQGRSYQLLPAAVVLNGYRKLMISTGSTSTTLTSIGLNYLFSILPNDDDLSIVLARYVHEKDLKKIIILSDGTRPSEDLVIRVRSELMAYNIDVVFEIDSSVGGVDQLDRSLLFIMDNDIFKPTDVDGFFLISKWPLSYSVVIQHMRKFGLNQPIFGPPNLDSRELVNAVGKDLMKDVYTVTTVDQQHFDRFNDLFAKEYYKKYGKLPFADSYRGYEAIKLLSEAINDTNSFDPAGVANYLRGLRYKNKNKSSGDKIAFDNKGLITDENINIIVHDGEGFKVAATYSKPFSWDNDEDINASSMIKSLIAGDLRNQRARKRRIRGL